MDMYAVVVGSGIAGSIVARRLAEGGAQALVVEKRNHVGGYCYDYRDRSGILIHRYGPHIFRTDSVKVWDYLSRFTEWEDYQHKVLTNVYGQLYPMPINLDTINQFLGTDYTAENVDEYFERHKTHPHTIDSVKIDEYFEYCFGRLPYRSVSFQFETYPVERYQPAAVVNYPNNYNYTRITEFKQFYHVNTANTVIAKEIPGSNGDPSYPIPTNEARELYKKYASLPHKGVTFIGRLGEYRYYSMDQVMERMMELPTG